MPTTARVDRSGGFAAPAQRRTRAVNVDALGAADRREFEELLSAAAPSFAAANTSTRAQPTPDATYVRLHIDDGRAVREATWSESSLPAAARTLARWIEEHASE
ncbi:MAG TPA: protealysin inhibitor emfourin [Myxococcota bacterium]|nr:protealysin inhibitor emfourin [Myxococcota bacterium]